jgi:hypothetical protein
MENDRKNTNMSALAHDKHDYPILEYQEKFKSNYLTMKTSLQNINANITNYKNEIVKLEDFLVTINEHENNYKAIIKKFTNLKKILEDTIEIEQLISKLSSNQQIINMSEYVNLYAKVKEIIRIFQDSPLTEKEDFISNMKKLMFKGFKVYEESFYVILKRYEQLDNSTGMENEKMNLLNKIRSLAECLQDELFKYDFTSRLIRERSDKICSKLDDIKINANKNTQTDHYEKNSGPLTIMLIEIEKLFQNERVYIFKILETCEYEMKSTVYANIIREPLEKLLSYLKELVNKHGKANIKKSDFYQNLDLLNIWHEKMSISYKSLVGAFNKDHFSNINALMKIIEAFCFNYVDTFLKDMYNLNNEKIETENVLTVCNETLFLLSNLLIFEYGYEFIRSEFESQGKDFSAEGTIDLLIKRIESKSSFLDKKFQPLKYIFLINNVFFIKSKIQQKPFNMYINKDLESQLSEKIKSYIEGYLQACWSKVDEITFKNDKDSIVYESDGKTLKNVSREIIKKKFATFNETMKMNLKFQKHIQIIDPSLEKALINSNIEHIAERYQRFYDLFNNSGFTKFRNKYIQYVSSSDITQDLKMYFMPDVSSNHK